MATVRASLPSGDDRDSIRLGGEEGSSTPGGDFWSTKAQSPKEEQRRKSIKDLYAEWFEIPDQSKVLHCGRARSSKAAALILWATIGCVNIMSGPYSNEPGAYPQNPIESVEAPLGHCSAG